MLLFAFPAMADEPAGTSDENPLPRILRDWAKRRQEVGLVTYRFSGTRTWPRGAFTPEAPPPPDADSIDEDPPWSKFSSSPLPSITNAPAENPPRDVSGLLNSTVTLDFRNIRCRIEGEVDAYNNLSGLLEHFQSIHVGNEGLYASHILQGITNGPPNRRIDFLILKGDRSLIPQGAFEAGYYNPLLFASGVVPTGDQRVKTVDIAPEIDATAFKFTGYATEAKRRLAILRVEFKKDYSLTTHYWVDLERDSAIVRYTSDLGGEQVMILEVDYQEAGGTWLPNHWTTLYKTWSGRVARTNLTESVAVAEVKRLTDISGERFVLKPSPGMYVLEYQFDYDATTSEFITDRSGYLLTPSGDRTEPYTNLTRLK